MSAKYEWLLVGLGNPGKKYENTRHNIGWMVIEALAEKYNQDITIGSSIYYMTELKIAGKNIIAIMPTTYMNLSGEAVRKVSDKFQIPVDRIIVINDEYNFSVGKVHLKQDGSDGGHNGILSIIEELQATEFFRLRCGIGNNFLSGQMVRYVLSKFEDDEEEAKMLMINKAIDSIKTLIELGKNRAMSLVNSGKLWEENTTNLSQEGNSKHEENEDT